MKFSQFIKEAALKEPKWVPKKMEPKEIVEWCEKNSPKFLKNKSPIFRGTRSNMSGLLDTKGLHRTSKDTTNHYTLWVDNSSKWSKYPKRSESVICTTDDRYAKDFGDVYYVIPEDTAKIGVCPYHDFWESFQNSPGHPTDINKWLHDAGITDNSWESMIKDIKDFDNNPVLKDWHNYGLKTWIQNMDTDYLKTALDEYYDPVINKFSIATPASSLPPKVEVWISGVVMLINDRTEDPILLKFIKENFS